MLSFILLVFFSFQSGNRSVSIVPDSGHGVYNDKAPGLNYTRCASCFCHNPPSSPDIVTRSLQVFVKKLWIMLSVQISDEDLSVEGSDFEFL
jgi:hypothetical protein